MNQSIDVQAWRKDGERLWARIQESKLVAIFWNNPWFRFAIPGAVLVMSSLAAAIVWRNGFVSVAFGILSLPFVYTSAKYYLIRVRTGGLYSFFSEKGFGIGCDADRLSFPYSSIRLPEKVSPATVNDNYIVLPIKAEITGVTIERKNGTDSSWDGTPYKRGIATVFIKDGAVLVKAYPNEMIVHLFCAIYPLSMYLTSQAIQPIAAPNAGSADDPPASTN